MILGRYRDILRDIMISTFDDRDGPPYGTAVNVFNVFNIYHVSRLA